MWQWGQDNNINGIGGNGGLEISHFSGFNPNNNAVPEPTTMLLFGTGLIGLTGIIRKKRK
nr:PEP-CTERM sorting domain-containing protein [Desulfogranum marinum]